MRGGLQRDPQAPCTLQRAAATPGKSGRVPVSHTTSNTAGALVCARAHTQPTANTSLKTFLLYNC